MKSKATIRVSGRLCGRRGVTLLECLISMVIVTMVAIGVISAMVFARQSLELDKQRIAAMNYARQAMEAANTNASIDQGTVTLVPFNTPGVEIAANITVNFYSIGTDGTVDWSNVLATPPAGAPAYCRVAVDWTPPGSWSRPQRVSMSTIVRAGTI